MILATDSLGLRFIKGSQVLGEVAPPTTTVPNWLDVWLEAIVCSPLGLVHALEPVQLISTTATADLPGSKEAVVNWMRNLSPLSTQPTKPLLGQPDSHRCSARSRTPVTALSAA